MDSQDVWVQNSGVNEEEIYPFMRITEKWNISQLFDLEQENIPLYGIIVLNRPISHNRNHVINLWRNAKLKLTVDGGTDRWETFLHSLDDETRLSLEPPDLITGDFDSIKKVTLDMYRSRGCKIVHTPDQNNSDFTKAVMEMNAYCLETGVPLDAIIAITETSGRLDHIMANINTLFLCVRRKLLQNENTKVYLMSNDSISWLLSSGEHVIDIPEKLRLNELWCAMVPVGEECTSVTTVGLKWNLANGILKFGDLVSTSNTYDGSPTVKIKCSHPLLWSMKIKLPL